MARKASTDARYFWGTVLNRQENARVAKLARRRKLTRYALVKEALLALADRED